MSKIFCHRGVMGNLFHQSISDYLGSLYEEGLADSGERRGNLNKKMTEMMAVEKDCSHCPGYCCTYMHNSMLVDPLQAIEILCYLEKNNRLNSQLIENLQQTVIEFRLDKELFIGRGREFRRNYTCPFFKDMSLGCSIGRDFKPYGCLGFNPLEIKVSTQGRCGSDLVILSEREEQFFAKEDLANKKIKEDLKLDWDKKNIPSALLDILAKIQ